VTADIQGPAIAVENLKHPGNSALLTTPAFGSLWRTSPSMAAPSRMALLRNPIHRAVELNNEAVLNRETGLVWRRSPDSLLRNLDWATGADMRHVLGFSVGIRTHAPGNRAGWRLPSIE
jgi:hypothetical protein